MRRRLLALALLALLLPPLATPLGAWASAAATAAGGLADLAFTQRLGAALPLDAPLVDETGQATNLRLAAGGLPLVLVPGYFRCPNLCGTVRADILSALSRSGLVSGRDYALAAVTIDPAETAATAAEVRRDELVRYKLPGGAERVHYLTGPASSLDAIAAAEGFHARWDDRFKQFMHPAGLVFATPAGKVSGYLLGVGYTPGALTAAVERARQQIPALAQPVLLLCFHFDATTGRYTLEVMKVLRLAAALTVLTIGGMLWLLRRHERTRRRRAS